jgi:hypothetical protein
MTSTTVATRPRATVDAGGGRIFGAVPFAMIPEWILDHPDLSDRAVRLWGILHRYATLDGGAVPGRATLARRCGGCSTDSIDRAKRQLVKVGALRVENRGRSTRGDFQTNDYYLQHEPPADAGSRTPAPTREPAPTGSRGGAATGSRTRAAEVRDPREGEKASAASDGEGRNTEPDHVITAAHWERCKAEGKPTPVVRGDGRGRGAGKSFVAVRAIVGQLLDAQWPADEVQSALWETDGGHTLNGLALFLTRRRARAQGLAPAALADRDAREAGQRGGAAPEPIADPKCATCGGGGWAQVDEAGEVVPFDSPRLVDEKTTSRRCSCVVVP